MGVRIEYTFVGQKQDFFAKCISDGHANQNMAHKQSKKLRQVMLLSIET